MSGAARAFEEWFEENGEGDFSDYFKDDLADAFAAGWNLAMGATWEPGGMPAHPGHPDYGKETGL